MRTGEAPYPATTRRGPAPRRRRATQGRRSSSGGKRARRFQKSREKGHTHLEMVAAAAATQVGKPPKSQTSSRAKKKKPRTTPSRLQRPTPLRRLQQHRPRPSPRCEACGSGWAWARRVTARGGPSPSSLTTFSASLFTFPTRGKRFGGFSVGVEGLEWRRWGACGGGVCVYLSRTMRFLNHVRLEAPTTTLVLAAACLQPA